MQKKSPWASKTLWANAIALVASVLAIFGFDLGPDVQAGIVTAALAVVNIVLRFTTTKPIVGKS